MYEISVEFLNEGTMEYAYEIETYEGAEHWVLSEIGWDNRHCHCEYMELYVYYICEV